MKEFRDGPQNEYCTYARWNKVPVAAAAVFTAVAPE